MPRTPLIALLFSVLSVGAPAAAAQAQAQAAPSQAASKLVQEAVRYEHAEGRVRDYARAHGLYCEAARMKSADALVRMGWMYANGRGVPRNDAIAHQLFSRAGSQGSEFGKRLAGMIKASPGSKAALPACLDGGNSGSDVLIDGSGTPGLGNPARFVAAPTSLAHRQLVEAVVAQAREFKIDPRLVFAVMRTESNFNPRARSPKNAQGLMQLMPGTAERFAVVDVFDPVQNMRGGIRYLRWLLSYFRGDVVLALAAYNAGEGAVDRYRGVPPYGETMAYVARIRALYPHDRHPFDPRVATASPIVPKPAVQLAEASLSAPAPGAIVAIE